MDWGILFISVVLGYLVTTAIGLQIRLSRLDSKTDKLDLLIKQVMVSRDQTPQEGVSRLSTRTMWDRPDHYTAYPACSVKEATKASGG